MFDIFLTHDWRPHPDLDRAMALLDSVWGLQWRNFGTPWHDPTIKLDDARGSAIVKRLLESQVLAAAAVLLLPAIYTGSQRGRLWVGEALALARSKAIPIVGLMPAEGVSPELTGLADQWVPWEAEGVAQTLRQQIERSRLECA